MEHLSSKPEIVLSPANEGDIEAGNIVHDSGNINHGSGDINQDSGYGSGASSTRLHPDEFDHAHIESIQVFAQDLQEAMKGSFPRESDPYPYTSVTVLMLRWEEDDLGVEDEIYSLDAVFTRRFGFDTEVWCIPSSPNPTRLLQSKLYAFQEAHQSEKELLIVYYGGHGEADPRRGRSIWRANGEKDSPSVSNNPSRLRLTREAVSEYDRSPLVLNMIMSTTFSILLENFLNIYAGQLSWSSLQPLLETAVPHVLIILDCCFAANAARDTTTGTTKELLAACGREHLTSGVGVRSFTSALVDELEDFEDDRFTVARLHSRLVTIRWRLEHTPVYALLSEHGGPSIHLEPHPRKKTQMREPMTLERPQREDTRVLLAITISQNAVLSLDRWVQWLQTGAPKDILTIDARLESIFESHSTLALISVSIEIWDRLRENEAYQFVAFVRSRNLLQDSDDALKSTKELGLKALSRASPFSSARRPVKTGHPALGTPFAIPENDEVMSDAPPVFDLTRRSTIADSGYGSDGRPSRYLSGKPGRRVYPVPLIQRKSGREPDPSDTSRPKDYHGGLPFYPSEWGPT